MFATAFDIEDRTFQNRKTFTAVTVTIVVHGIILLILLFRYLYTPIPPFQDNAGGMSVNFGTDAVGTGDEQPFTYNPGPVATRAAPAPAKSEPVTASPDNLLTQENEESEVTAPKAEDKPKKKINKEAVFKPVHHPVNSTNTVKPSKVENTAPPQPRPDANALFSKGAYGRPNNSKGDGTGGGQGDQGSPNGDPNSRNYTGDGQGNGQGHGVGDLNGSGFSLHGRTRVSLPAPNQCSISGKVIISIKVDKTGHVIDAELKRIGSTTFDECNVNNALAAARRATFNPDPNAPDVQEGTITYIYKVQ